MRDDDNERISLEEARGVLELEGAELQAAIAESSRLRERRHGRSVNLCWIVNARSGHCDQDCAFCSQSSRSRAEIRKHQMLAPEEIVRDSRRAAEAGAVRYSIVASGSAMRPGRDLDRVLEAADRIVEETGLAVCASLGVVEPPVLRALKDAGVSRYHHNLETAESFWPRVCGTRPWEGSRRVIREAKGNGLETCCGGIFGLGESSEQRIELLEEVRRLDVDSTALNFFVPVAGTPLEDLDELEPLDCLRITVAARMMMPEVDVRICGGRERNARELQAWLLPAGASGLMVGGYLTTGGRPVEEDLRMIADSGFEPDSAPEGRITVVGEDPY